MVDSCVTQMYAKVVMKKKRLLNSPWYEDDRSKHSKECLETPMYEDLVMEKER